MRVAILVAMIAGGIGVLAGLESASQAERDTAAVRQRKQSATNPQQPARQPDRSPLAIAIDPKGRFCATANHTASSVSFVDLNSGRVVCEHRCGNGPAGVIWIDSETLLVSLKHDDAVVRIHFDRQRSRATTAAVLSVGDEPAGLALASVSETKTGSGTLRKKTKNLPRLAFVALSGADQVAVVDLLSMKVVRRIPVGGRPTGTATSPNGQWLVTCCSVPGQVFVHEISTFNLISRRTVFDDGFNLGRPWILHDSSAVIIPHPINRAFPVTATNVEKGWVIDNRLTRFPLPRGKYWEQKQLGLDTRGRAAGDANAVAVSADGKWLVVSCGGSHELLILDRKRMKWPAADPGDFLPDEIRNSKGVLRHVKLGGRPVDVRFLDTRRAIVANSLSNCLQVVDVVRGTVERTIPLGGPKTPSLMRRGEAIFYDADRSLDSWFSCHTCHTDGQTSGQTFDTLNDGNFDTYKLVPSLHGVTKTGPWTWHGWQKSLPASLKKSLQTTLSTNHKITKDDIRAMMAYLDSLKHPRSPFLTSNGKLTQSASRGRTLFRNKAGCADCHSGDHFTSDETYKVGLESQRYFFPSFNPPSLRGLHGRRRFLHDGRANSLKEVLTRHHQPQKLTGEKLTKRELAQLIEYLKSL